MEYTISCDNYNPKYYSQPWISKVLSWKVAKRPVMRRGRYTIDHWGGSIGHTNSGHLIIYADPGSIIRWGQNSLRRHKTKSKDNWGITQSDGAVEDCTAVEARQAWKEKQND